MSTFNVLCGIFLSSLFLVVVASYIACRVGAKQQKILDDIFESLLNQKKKQTIDRIPDEVDERQISINTILEIFKEIPEREKQLFQDFLEKRTYLGYRACEKDVLESYFVNKEKFIFIALLLRKGVIFFLNGNLMIKNEIFNHYKEMEIVIEAAVMCGFDNISKYNYETYQEAVIYLQNEIRE